MGVDTQGIITNHLTKKEILEVPKILNGLNLFLSDDDTWHWQDNDIDEAFLDKYWERTEAWYHENLAIGNLDIYKDAIIWGPRLWCISFMEPGLISISPGWRWYSFEDNAEIRNKIIEETTTVAKLFKADRILFTYDFGSADTEQEKKWNAF